MTDDNLPHNCMVTTCRQDGHLFVLLWCTGHKGQRVVIGFDDIRDSTRDMFSQLGMHVAHFGRHGWTTIDDTKRLPL